MSLEAYLSGQSGSDAHGGLNTPTDINPFQQNGNNSSFHNSESSFSGLLQESTDKQENEVNMTLDDDIEIDEEDEDVDDYNDDEDEDDGDDDDDDNDDDDDDGGNDDDLDEELNEENEDEEFEDDENESESENGVEEEDKNMNYNLDHLKTVTVDFNTEFGENNYKFGPNTNDKSENIASYIKDEKIEKTAEEKVRDHIDSILDAVAKNEIGGENTGGNVQDKETPKEKPKKTRKRKKNTDEKKKEKKKRKVKPANFRRNIREIKETALESTTLEAQNEELERKKRLQELKKSLMEKEKEKDSQLKSLLEDDEEEKNNEVILLDSSDEGKTKKKDGDVIDISSDEDDIVITTDADDNTVESEDPNNSGSHIDDALNHPDEQGRVLVNIGHPPDEPDLFLAPQIAKYIKRHQIGGVRFLYDNLVESLSRFKSSPGFGCILAHSMGLGKTIQMISLIDILLRYTAAKSVLLIVPINTLQNWLAEINMWCPESVPEGFPDVQLRNFKCYILNDSFKTPGARAKVIVEWHKTGGVLLMGYEMYRLMTSRKGHIAQPKKPGRKPVNSKEMVIDVDEEDKTKDMFVDVHDALINPGPDLVVCDEGHRIKNSHAGISQSLKNIRTRRRVVLTGYPLQNNLIEYWCMVDFVRPNYLGNKTEFCNMFERPIMNGQCADSTDSDTKLMRYRAHVLHSLLEGFVQRRGHTVLQAALPPKQEYICLITMSQIQKMLYKEFMDNLAETSLNTWATTNPLKAFSVCCKIWNHPDILYKIMRQKKIDISDDNDLDIETDPAGGKKRGKKASSTGPSTPQPGSSPFSDRRNDQVITYEWAEKLLKDYTPGQLEMGGKMLLLFEIIHETLALGDKLLIFSQSLYTLSLVEEFLSKMKVPRPDMDEFWCKNKNYYRLDGSTLAQEREKLIGQFNAVDNNRVWLFLLSTRAGSLGINLVGANRVVVLDASWNPCHDCQAVCRVFRFGQMKPCFIYRLVTDNTMERKIYDRQINKQGMSDRVVDELQPQNNFSKSHVDNLLHYEDVETDPLDFSNAHNEYDDDVLVKVLQRQGHWLTKKPFTHESLLIDKKELRLSKKEKRLAKQSYVMEKRLNLTYTRPSYAAFYPKAGGGPQIRPTHHPPWNQPTTFNRPVASVKPMMTTPVPMKPKDGVSVIPQTKPGVTVHKIITTTDITLPGTSTNTQAGVSASGGTMLNKIPAGQQVFVIKTPKGVYIRTKEGKIFAVRAKTPLVSGLSTATSTPVTTVTIKNSTATVAPKVGTAQPIIVYPKTSTAKMEKKPQRQPPKIKPSIRSQPQNARPVMKSETVSGSEPVQNRTEVNQIEPNNFMDTSFTPARSDENNSSHTETQIKTNNIPNVQGESSSESLSNRPVGFDRQNSRSSQLSSADEGSQVQFGLSDNNDSQFGSDVGNLEQSDNSNSNSQLFETDNYQRNEHQQGFLDSLFDQSEITPFTPSRQNSNSSMNRIDSSASIASNVGHIDLRDENERFQEDGNESMDMFMSRYPRIAPNMRNNYPAHNNPMSHMFNPMQGFNQGSQMGYNPMYSPYPVLFPPNSHNPQPVTTDGSVPVSSQSNEYMSPIQSMSQMGSNPMMGFPFAPYPFPMPSPYMMGNPYMAMGMAPPYGPQGGMVPPSKGSNRGPQVQDNNGSSSQ